MYSAFTPSHRGGFGPPLVCLHGFTDTWRTWELVLPVLERRHDVLAPTLLAMGNRTESPGCLVEQAVNRALGSTFDEAEALLLSRFGDVTLKQLAADIRGNHQHLDHAHAS